LWHNGYVDINSIAKEYLQGDFSLDYLANKYGYTRETLRRRFVKFGIERKSKFRKIQLPHKKKFQKGNIPWNKNLKYDKELKIKLDTKGLELGRGYFRGQILKETYPNIHYWVRKHKKYPEKCNDCGQSNKRLEWSNVDHKYRRVLSDYIRMCTSCHRKYDIEHNSTPPNQWR